MSGIRYLRPLGASDGAMQPGRTRGRYDLPARLGQAGRPVLVTAEPRLRDEVQRIAAAAGVDLDIRPDTAAIQAAWSLSPLIAIGMDVGAAVAAAMLPRRTGVVLVATTGLDDVARYPVDGSMWHRAVEIGAEHVLLLPDGDAWLADRLADCAEERGNPGSLLCVIGGRGGAGATTLAAAIAGRAADRGAATMLVDADPLGGGIDLAVGCEAIAGTRWPDLVRTRGRVDAAALTSALPHVGSIAVLACDRTGPSEIPADAMVAVLAAAQRVCEVIVVDLPRAMTPASVEALRRSTRALLVVPAEVRATASAARVCAAVRLFASEVEAVVRGPGPSGLAGRSIADALGVRLAGEVTAEKGLARALDCGEVPGRSRRSPVGRFADRVLDEVWATAAVA